MQFASEGAPRLFGGVIITCLAGLTVGRPSFCAICTRIIILRSSCVKMRGRGYVFRVLQPTVRRVCHATVTMNGSAHRQTQLLTMLHFVGVRK